jgi:hypothetical protein
MADLREWEERAQAGDGQFAIALAVWRCADMLKYLGFDAPDGRSPGAFEFVGMMLKGQVEATNSVASSLESVASAIEGHSA